jgi:hypothetical protein
MAEKENKFDFLANIGYNMCMFTFNQILENLEILDASCDSELDNEINVVAVENGLSADEDRMEILEILAEEKAS